MAVLSPHLLRRYRRRKRLKELLRGIDYHEKARALHAEDKAVQLLRGAVGKPRQVTQRLKEGHDWLALFAAPTRQWTAGRKAARLVADVLTVMFWDATLFGLEYPQDPMCPSYPTEDECMNSAAGANAHPSCTWDEFQGGCVFFEPEESLSEAIYIAMLVIMLTLPPLICVSCILKYMIMLPHKPFCWEKMRGSWAMQKGSENAAQAMESQTPRPNKVNRLADQEGGGAAITSSGKTKRMGAAKRGYAQRASIFGGEARRKSHEPATNDGSPVRIKGGAPEHTPETPEEGLSRQNSKMEEQAGGLLTDGSRGRRTSLNSSVQRREAFRFHLMGISRNSSSGPGGGMNFSRGSQGSHMNFSRGSQGSHYSRILEQENAGSDGSDLESSGSATGSSNGSGRDHEGSGAQITGRGRGLCNQAEQGEAGAPLNVLPWRTTSSKAEEVPSPSSSAPSSNYNRLQITGTGNFGKEEKSSVSEKDKQQQAQISKRKSLVDYMMAGPSYKKSPGSDEHDLWIDTDDILDSSQKNSPPCPLFAQYLESKTLGPKGSGGFLSTQKSKRMLDVSKKGRSSSNGSMHKSRSKDSSHCSKTSKGLSASTRRGNLKSAGVSTRFHQFTRGLSTKMGLPVAKKKPEGPRDLEMEMKQLENYLDQKVAHIEKQRTTAAVDLKGDLDWMQFHPSDETQLQQASKRPLAAAAAGAESAHPLANSLSFRHKLREMDAALLGHHFEGGRAAALVQEEVRRFKDHEGRMSKSIRKIIWAPIHSLITKQDDHDRLVAEIQKHVMLSIYLEESLQSMPLADQNAAVLAAAQLDYMSFTECRILERVQEDPDADADADAAEEQGEEKVLWPRWIPVLGWFLLIGYIMTIGFYIVLFGVRFGEKMVNMWLSTFFIGFFHDVILFIPIQIYIIYKVVPTLLSGHLDLHRVGQLPPYAGSLQVARRFPHLTAARVLLERRLPPRRHPLRRYFAAGGRRWACVLRAAGVVLLAVLVIFPYDIQDMIIETTINAIYSHTLLGTILFLEHTKAGAASMIAVLGVLVGCFFFKKYHKKKTKKKKKKERFAKHATKHEGQPSQAISPTAGVQSPSLSDIFPSSDIDGQGHSKSVSGMLSSTYSAGDPSSCRSSTRRSVSKPSASRRSSQNDQQEPNGGLTRQVPSQNSQPTSRRTSTDEQVTTAGVKRSSASERSASRATGRQKSRLPVGEQQNNDDLRRPSATSRSASRTTSRASRRRKSREPEDERQQGNESLRRPSATTGRSPSRTPSKAPRRTSDVPADEQWCVNGLRRPSATSRSTQKSKLPSAGEQQCEQASVTSRSASRVSQRKPGAPAEISGPSFFKRFSSPAKTPEANEGGMQASLEAPALPSRRAPSRGRSRTASPFRGPTQRPSDLQPVPQTDSSDTHRQTSGGSFSLDEQSISGSQSHTSTEQSQTSSEISEAPRRPQRRAVSRPRSRGHTVSVGRSSRGRTMDSEGVAQPYQQQYQNTSICRGQTNNLPQPERRAASRPRQRGSAGTIGSASSNKQHRAFDNDYFGETVI